MTRVQYELRSILERIDLRELFPVQQPLEVELGSGDGSFLAAWAKLNPGQNFIGVERLLGRVRKTERKAERANLKNVRCVRIESRYFLEYLLPPGAAETIHVYFPDPWPKRKHRRHRLINEDFPRLASSVLTAEGAVYLRTDDPDYFQQMREVFSNAKEFREVETPQHVSEVVTDFERGFLSKGISTLRAAYRKSR